MSDGYLISLVRGLGHDEEAEDDSLSGAWLGAAMDTQVPGSNLSEKLVRYLTPECDERWLPVPESHPTQSLRENAQGVTSPDVCWWRQSVGKVSPADPLTFMGEAESEPVPAAPRTSDAGSPPPRRQHGPRAGRSLALKPTSPARLLEGGLLDDVSNSWLCSDTFESVADLRLLCSSIYVLSRTLCPECTDPASNLQAASDVNLLQAQIAKLDWLSFRIPHSNSSQGSLTLVQALAVVVVFVHRLQVHELRRHTTFNKSPPPIPFEATFWSLAAALSLQHRLQLESHKTNGICQLGSCCCPGLALGAPSSPSFTDSAQEAKKRSSLFSRILDLRVLHPSVSPLIKRSKASLANDSPTPPPVQKQSREFSVLLRDCSALMEVLQRFCTCLIIGSAWVDEQEPISSTVVGRFLSSAFGVLSAAKVCRRTCSPGTSRIGDHSKNATLRRMAAATTLYLSFVPCMNSAGGPESDTTCCIICRPQGSPMQPQTPREEHQREISLRRAHGASRTDFERKMFNIMCLVDHRLCLDPGDLLGIANTLLELLTPLIPLPTTSGSSVASATTTVGGPTNAPESSYSATEVSDQQLGYSVPSVRSNGTSLLRHRSLSASAVWRQGEEDT